MTGKLVTWNSISYALADLARPVTLAELCDHMWTMYQDYCQTLDIGLRLQQRPDRDKLSAGVQSVLDKHGDSVHSAQVGPGDTGQTFIWLSSGQWPGAGDLESWRSYRTVHQAVRCAIQEMIDSGERYNGVFAQVCNHTLLYSVSTQDVRPRII